jgi:large subunit ribosomal protein L4
MAGEIKGQVDLDDKVFAVVHQALLRQLANKRQGTASTKTRSEVAGSTRKLFRQKHTGNARAGSMKSGLRRGGGIFFGPKPRDYNQSMPKPMRRLAIKCVLSAKASENEIVILDELKFEAARTRDMVKIINALKIDGKTLIALDTADENTIKSARNISGITTIQARQLNVADLTSHKKLVMTESALRQVEALWGETAITGEVA